MKKETLKGLGERFFNERSDSAYSALYHRIMPGLKNHCYRFVKDYDTADDLAIMAMTKAYNKIHQFNVEYNISTWIYSIASNEARQYLKKRKKKGHVLFSQMEYTNEEGQTSLDRLEAIVSVENEFMAREEAQSELDEMQAKYESTIAIIETMKESFRNILMDRFVYDLSYNELAEKHDVSLQVVKNTVNRGRKRIQEEYKKNLIETNA